MGPDGFSYGIGTLLNSVGVPYIEQILRRHGTGLSGQLVLEVGCRGGLPAKPLCELGVVVTGVDVSIRSVAAGRGHGTSVWYAGARAERLPFPDTLSTFSLPWRFSST